MGAKRSFETSPHLRVFASGERTVRLAQDFARLGC
jgi:hypothetical protein